MESELKLLQANIEWLSEKVSLINTNIFAVFSITIAVFGIIGVFFIKTVVDKKVDKEFKQTLSDVKLLEPIKLELNRVPGVMGFYEHYTATFDFQKYKIKHESDILNAYISKICYPMYNTEILKRTLDQQKIEENNDNEDVSLQHIRQEMYQNNTNINQKGFKSIYDGFSIQFDFESNLINVFLPYKSPTIVASMDNDSNSNNNKNNHNSNNNNANNKTNNQTKSNNQEYSKLYCEFQVINPKYK